ncbi:MAG: AsmA family protein [Proteobacteria bacterium]|nr:AsmA family protein [Pseudomonadota bacterium]
MKKVLFGAFGLLVLLVAVVLIGPGLIDWNQYKGEIAAQAKAITGRDLTIDGDIQITVLPAPALVVKDVALANLEGATATEMVRLKSLEIRVALGPLLRGQIQVETIKLDTPVIELEVIGDGRRNWDFPAPAGKEKKDAGPPTADGAAPKAGPRLDVRLDNFIIENGTVVYRDLKGGTVERVHGINARIAASSMTGPFEMSGRAQVRGVPLEYDISVGQIIEGRTVPFSANLGFEPGGTKVQIAGALLGLGGSPKFKGKVKGEGKSLAELIQALAGAGPLPGLLGQAFELSGDVVATTTDLEIKDLAVSLGTSQAKGGLSAKLGEVPNVSLNLAVSRIDLDKWLSMPASVAKPREPSAPRKTPVTGGQNKASIELQVPKKAPKAAKEAGFQLPANINGVLEVAVETITYRGGIIRQARLGLELANGEATISQLSAQLPGGTEVAFFGFITAAEGKPRLEGEIETVVSDLRGLLGWLEVEIPDIPAHRLRKLTLSGKIMVTPEQVEASDLDFLFDSSRLSGGITVALSSRPSFGADLTLDRLNLDAYLPASGATPVKKTAAKKNEKKDVKAAAPAGQLAVVKALGSFDANVKVRIKTLVFKGTPINDVVFDGTLFDDKLTVRRAGIANLFGASANIQGTVRNITKVPEFEGVAFQLRAADLTRLFRLAGQEPPLDLAKLGAVSVKGKLDGSLLKPAIELTLRAAKSEVGLSGFVELLSPGFAGTVRVRNGNLPRLLRALGVDYRPPGRFGGLNLKANLRGNPNSLALSAIEGQAGPVTFSGTVKATLGGARPMIKADLRTSEIVVEKFLPAKKTASIAPWRPSSPGRPIDRLIPAAWSANPAPGGIFRHAAAGSDRRWPVDPIDLSALRAFDADITLKAPAIVYGTYRLNGADLAATVRDGTLNATRIDGTLFGGVLRANAVLEAGPPNRIQAALDIKGMDVGQATRAVTGKGLATGKMGVNIKLATAGRSVADMVSALSGSGSLSLQRLDVKAGAKGTALAAALELVNALNGLGGMFGDKKRNTGLADISGSFRMDRGIAKSNDLRLTSNLGTGLAGGSVDLPRWLIDVSGEVRLAENVLTNIIARAAKTVQAPRILPFRIKGRLDAPTVKLDTSRLGTIPIPGVEKLLQKAPKGVGAILQQIIPGLGGQTQQQPQQQQPQQPGTEPPPPPPPPPEQKFKPQDFLKELLKGF